MGKRRSRRADYGTDRAVRAMLWLGRRLPYAALFENKAQSLKQRMGTIAPKAAGSTELP